MNAGNFIVGWLALFALCGVGYWTFLSESGLRCGLWLNGVDGRRQDEVVAHWKKTKGGTN